MTEDDKRNCCLLEIQETEAKYYRTLEDIEKVGGARASSWWPRGPLGRAVAGRGPSQVLGGPRPCRQAPRQQRRLPSLPVCPLTPCPRPEPWAPARPVSSSTSPLSLLPPPAPRPSAWALVHPPELLSGSFQPQLGHNGFCSESPELNSMYALPASRAPYVYPPGRAPAELLMYTSSLRAPSALSLSL